jgi:hypothetical protein
MSIEPGQIYRSVNLSSYGFRIQITEVGTTTVRGNDVENRRPLMNRVPISQLHATPTTASGKPRSRGYVLEQPTV